MKCKSTLIIALSCSLFYCSDSTTQRYPHDQNITQWELTGPVKYVETDSYLADGDITDVVIDSIDLENYQYGGKSEMFFDKDGLLTKKLRYNQASISWDVTFDKFGYSSKSIYYSSEGQIIELQDMTYNLEGFPLKQTRYNSDSSILSTRTFEFNALGRKIYSKVVQRNRSHSFSYVYDDQGRETERKTFMAGIFESKRTTSYDRDGNSSRIVAFDSNGDILWERTNKYTNNLLSIKKVIKGEIETTSNYTYNDHGHLIQVVNKENRKEGVLVKNHQHIRTYDKRGNWTTKVEMENGLVRQVLFRKLEYY